MYLEVVIVRIALCIIKYLALKGLEEWSCRSILS
jgi:hypothetical protein